MSYVTSVVIACPAGWSREQADYLSCAVYRAHCQLRDDEVDEIGYAPVPDDSASGSKYPGGHVFWLGLNYAHMPEDILPALDADPLCDGAWVWWQGEDDDTPHTHLVGAPPSGA